MAFSLKKRDERLKVHPQQQIVKSQRLAAIGQLAAAVADGTNSPLGGVLINGHLFSEKAEAEDSSRKNLEKAVTEAKRCQNIVVGLLDFASGAELKVEQLNGNEISKPTVSFVENQAKIAGTLFSTKEVGHRIGLGLAVSYGIVAGHNRPVDLESKPSDATVFTVSLPVKTEA